MFGRTARRLWTVRLVADLLALLDASLALRTLHALTLLKIHAVTPLALEYLTLPLQRSIERRCVFLIRIWHACPSLLKLNLPVFEDPVEPCDLGANLTSGLGDG